ncbi:SCO3374 family protein [Streptomyces sp. NPDC006552]|uniref:SCO3374 family protein n=1 Tax=Streptomyces sp. NPDC006552 TaxID=3157179 RepID=UPI00339EE290
MVASSSVPGSAVPLPRRPLEAAGCGSDPVRRWYADALGWAAEPGPRGARLRTGVRFDVLELPADAGFAMLHRCDPRSPVAVRGETMQLLVAAGSADEVPGLLDWLEWGALATDLVALGADGFIDAPTPPGWAGPQEAATWARPPEPGRDLAPVLPALTSLAAVSTSSAVGGGGGAPDLVRLVDTAATHCHRARLRRASAAPGPQPLAFS